VFDAPDDWFPPDCEVLSELPGWSLAVSPECCGVSAEAGMRPPAGGSFDGSSFAPWANRGAALPIASADSTAMLMRVFLILPSINLLRPLSRSH
jgi:hypothetical protein